MNLLLVSIFIHAVWSLDIQIKDDKIGRFTFITLNIILYQKLIFISSNIGQGRGAQLKYTVVSVVVYEKQNLENFLFCK